MVRSLERLFIIPRHNPFVNTFFQKNSIFLKFFILYSFRNFSSKEIAVLNTSCYDFGTFLPISKALILVKIKLFAQIFKKLCKTFQFLGWIFIITRYAKKCKYFFFDHSIFSYYTASGLHSSQNRYSGIFRSHARLGWAAACSSVGRGSSRSTIHRPAPKKARAYSSIVR